MTGDSGVWVTVALTIIVIVIGFVAWNNRVQYKDVGASYYRVVALREVHKLLSAPLVHASVWHIGINLFLLWATIVQVEMQHGWEWTLRHVILYAVSTPPPSIDPTFAAKAPPSHPPQHSCLLHCYCLECRPWSARTTSGSPMCE